jgi:hypothetical protein
VKELEEVIAYEITKDLLGQEVTVQIPSDAQLISNEAYHRIILTSNCQDDACIICNVYSIRNLYWYESWKTLYVIGCQATKTMSDCRFSPYRRAYV